MQKQWQRVIKKIAWAWFEYSNMVSSGLIFAVHGPEAFTQRAIIFLRICKPYFYNFCVVVYIDLDMTSLLYYYIIPSLRAVYSLLSNFGNEDKEKQQISRYLIRQKPRFVWVCLRKIIKIYFAS